jgi:RNA ligase (TIGR02306 family)
LAKNNHAKSVIIFIYSGQTIVPKRAKGIKMSSLIVEVCEISEILEHTNADKLSIAVIKGWQSIISKGSFKVGDKCVYFPPDCILTKEVADKLNATRHLVPHNVGEETRYRVKAANLRGVKSFGFIAKLEDESLPVGHDLVDFYSVTKYEPPIKATDGDAEREVSVFHKYFDMENIKNFPDAFVEGEEVVFTEKIHGQNCRLGLIKESNENGEMSWTWAAGSHDVRRKQFDKMGRISQFWECMTPEIKNLMADISGCNFSSAEIDSKPLANEGNNIVVFGERFGSGVQDMQYGLKKVSIRVFDITVNGVYLNFDEKVALCQKHGVEMVPILYRGPISKQKIEEYTDGPSLVCAEGNYNYFTGREGIVILTTVERPAITRKKAMSRCQFKSISFDYSNRAAKHKKVKCTEDH